MEYTCPKCNGLGVKDQQILELCDFCWGKKNNLNWLENIFGVKHPWREAIEQMVSIQPMAKSAGEVFHLKIKKNRSGDV